MLSIEDVEQLIGESLSARFTERTKQIITFAEEEARHFRHACISTEHILVGLLREQEGLAARTLIDLGVDAGTVCSHVVRTAG